MGTSKKRILNIASTKKRDNMPLFDADNPTLNYFAMSRGTSSYLFCPTYRDKELEAATESDRNRSTVYMKGYAETVHLGPSTGNSWKWRRIVFETKNSHPALSDVSAETSSGYKRLWKNQTEAQRNTLAGTLFEGTPTTDQSTYFTAKADRTRARIISDQTHILRNGNDVAYEKDYRKYYSFERNLVYDDDENGATETTSGWAADSRSGMGDVFIWDIFIDIGAPEGAALTVRSHSTLYWHEK